VDHFVGLSARSVGPDPNHGQPRVVAIANSPSLAGEVTRFTAVTVARLRIAVRGSDDPRSVREQGERWLRASLYVLKRQAKACTNGVRILSWVARQRPRRHAGGER
jgi:hypothetical protein